MTNLKAVPVAKYSSLRKGEIYTFEHYSWPKGKPAQLFHTRGRLLYVLTRMRKNVDKNHKVTSTEMVGDKVGWEPLDEEDQSIIWEPTGEKLRRHSTHVCCGLFRVLGSKT